MGQYWASIWGNMWQNGQHGESLGNSTAVCSVILADPLYNGGILMCGTLQSGQDIQDARLPGPGALGQGWGKGLQVELAVAGSPGQSC